MNSWPFAASGWSLPKTAAGNSRLWKKKWDSRKNDIPRWAALWGTNLSLEPVSVCLLILCLYPIPHSQKPSCIIKKKKWIWWLSRCEAQVQVYPRFYWPFYFPFISLLFWCMCKPFSTSFTSDCLLVKYIFIMYCRYWSFVRGMPYIYSLLSLCLSLYLVTGFSWPSF